MTDEILVTRRAAYAAEEEMQNLEKEKKHQDLLIDHLNQQLKQLFEQVKIYDAQVFFFFFSKWIRCFI